MHTTVAYHNSLETCDLATMHISSLLPLTILLGSLSPAGAIPVAEPAVDGIYARNEDIHYRDSSIVARDGPGFRMESVKYQGISPLGPSGYGDSVTDDTEAINNAISSGTRCGKDCFSSTVTPAVVYFPSGSYVISAPLLTTTTRHDWQPKPTASPEGDYYHAIHDPDFASTCNVSSCNCALGWGLRVIDSEDLHVYGAGFYSFFNNYDATCSAYGGPQNCQNSIFSIEGQSAISVYNLNVLGSKRLVDQDRKSLASYSDNIGVFTNNIAYFSTQ
ncbi:uncharacterized protein N7473_002130 [Penicillium subrubescens]|uniref:uncharacterized protein n=1 Tax=Penicillium subrubescens TaxID=1316194 RepID=UPI002545190D|nr:uncharacterized protein N7473_002130 [Penicillium subrubescens]KAJ5905214.1 hypothetical protein N7473_002130 [Penicillium subrubescens]